MTSLGKLVTNARNQPSTSTVYQTCSKTSTSWQGYEVAVQVSNAPSDQCQPLQNAIEASINDCKSATGSILNGAKIAGIVVGGLAGLALLAAGGFYAYYKCRDQCKIGPESDEEQQGLGQRRSI